MTDFFERTELLLGSEAMNRLAAARVAVFGIGGVGGHAAEALARSGVGMLDIIDKDKVSPSNINRQIVATISNIGRYKTDVMKERIRDINPDAVVNTYQCFFLPENAGAFPFASYDYIIDAVDTVTAKIELVMQARDAGVPIISCMGAGNKLDPTRFEVTDIYKTSVCPLAKVMRKELKARGIKKLRVVYSKEEIRKPKPAGKKQAGAEEAENAGKAVPGSVAFVPSVAGLILAGEVIKGLAQDTK